MNKYYTFEEVKKLAEKNPDNELLQISLKYNTSKLYDPECFGYFEHYWNHFKAFRDRDTNLLEIGVKDGQSLLMWDEFFKGKCCTFGVDINSTYKADNVFIGDQIDINFLQNINNDVGPFDIIIDDGGHTMSQQQISFSYLFPIALQEGGLYIIEDIGTSYWHRWGGGFKKPGTTVEFIKDLMDSISHRFYKGNRTDYVGIPESINCSYLDTHIKGIHFYRGLVFIEKGCNTSV